MPSYIYTIICLFIFARLEKLLTAWSTRKQIAMAITTKSNMQFSNVGSFVVAVSRGHTTMQRAIAKLQR